MLKYIVKNFGKNICQGPKKQMSTKVPVAANQQDDAWPGYNGSSPGPPAVDRQNHGGGGRCRPGKQGADRG